MATGEKPKATGNKKRKGYLPQNKPVKKKGAYPLRPGVQGFFITCDGGREHQAAQEALNVIDSFFEELVLGNSSIVKSSGIPDKPINKKITFSYSDDEGEDDGDNEDDNGCEEAEIGVGKGEVNEEAEKEEDKGEGCEKAEKGKRLGEGDENAEKGKGLDEGNEEVKKGEGKNENEGTEQKIEKNVTDDCDNVEKLTNEAEEPPKKKACIEINLSKSVSSDNAEKKSIDKLIEAELEELGDKNKRRFIKLDAGCNGLVFIQMRRKDGDPSPKDIVQHMMTSAAATKRHMSRFILRVIPVEVSCYASEEEISRAIKPLVESHFPNETEIPHKFAVLYGARANTGIDRMKIITAVAKSVPGPHKVDLGNPDKNIVVEVVKTVCLIGVVEKYKELAKYNLRQLTSPKP